MRPKVSQARGPLIRVQAPGPRAAWASSASARTVGVERRQAACSTTAASWTSPTSSGARGFHPGFSWIDLPIFDDDGDPRHDSGVADDAPGLYFVGLHFLHSLSSAMIHGVGRDARRLVRHIADRRAAAGTAAELAAA